MRKDRLKFAMLMPIEQRMIEVMKRAFHCLEDDVRIDHRFAGGMSNYTYLVYLKDHPYVVRILGEGGEVLVDPASEKKHLNIVKTLDITSNVVYFDVKTGVKISEYIEGTPLSKEISDEDYFEVADSLRRLHEAKLPGEDYHLKTRLRRYEKLLKTIPSETYYALKMQWLKLYDEYYHQFPKTLCHGDAQRSNLVKSHDKIYLLDWEFAGLNDPYYDIASFGNIDFKDAEKLLGFYLKREPNKEEVKKLRFYRMFQVLQWHIVATYKHEIDLSSKLNLNFEMIAQKYLNLAQELFEKIKG